MTWGFDWLLSFVDGFWSVIVSVVQWLVQGIIYAVETGLYFAWDGVLTVISGLVSGVNLGNLATETAQAWGLLPPQLAYLISATGIGNGLGMIGTGIGIRMLLNLIPAAFTRL